MRSTIVFVLVVGFSIPVNAREPSLDTHVEQRLLEIQLASCIAAYEMAMAKRNDVDLLIVQAVDAALLAELNGLHDRLSAHLEKLEVQSLDAGKRLEELAPRAGQIQKNAIDHINQTTSLPPAVRAEGLLRTMNRTIDFPGRPLRKTGRTLDVAIDGSGYFPVVDSTANSIAYTRLGNLDINATGHLAVGSRSAGLSLAPPIRIPDNASTVVISNSGIVSCRMPGDDELHRIGQIQVAVFEHTKGLLQIRENLLAETEASGAARLLVPGEHDSGTLRQGCLEVSDSARIRELIDVLIDYLKSVRPAGETVVVP